jgi:hypothetical protein
VGLRALKVVMGKERDAYRNFYRGNWVGLCRLTASKPELKARLDSVIRALKLKCDEPLSIVAFNFNLRRYNWDETHPAQFNISSQFTGTSFETKNSR